MTKPRKRVSPENEYDKFYDKAHANGYDVLVDRWVHEKQVLLQVRANCGNHELAAASVIDVGLLGESITEAGLYEQIEREAA